MLPKILLFLAAVAVVSCQTSTPAPSDPKVDRLATSIRNGLMNSPVLKKALPFIVQGGLRPHNVFFRVGTRLLARAGIVNPVLAEVAASAAQKAGKVTSELYFRTVGFEVAKFLSSYGLLTDENVSYFAFMVVSSIELQACINGVHNAETVSNAVVYGLYDVFKQLGLVTPENISKLFSYFSHEILAQSGKSESVDILAELKVPL